MKRIHWQLYLALALIAVSAVIYGLHYLVFQDPHHIFLFLMSDIAFVPVEVLLVTLILHRLLERRSRAEKLHKLNMVIGAFFSEVGLALLRRFAAADPQIHALAGHMIVTDEWQHESFVQAAQAVPQHGFQTAMDRSDLLELRDLLTEERQFMINLLGNPTLLEHDAFTDCLWAVFHLTEELDNRDDLPTMPETDYDHIRNDIQRAYSRTAVQWIDYMEHLKDHYPYLFSLAMRTNPFNPSASPVIR